MNDDTVEPIRLQTTPDMIRPLEPAPVNPMWRFVRYIFYLAATAVSGIVMGMLILALPGPVMPPTTFWGSIIGVLLCLYLVVAFHEVGHALGGRLADYHLVYLVVGPLRLGREVNGWRLRFLKDRLFAFGGWAYSVPKRRDGWRWRRSLFILGGPLASLLLALAVVGLRFAWHDMIIWPPLALTTHFLSFAAIAILPFSLIPMVIRGQRNDALILIDTLRLRGELARRQQALTWLIAEAFQGKRSRETDTAVLTELLYPADGSHEELMGSIWGYYYEMDRQQYRRAAAYLDRALAILQENPQPATLTLCALDAAFFEARYGRRPEVAAAWLELVDLKQATHPANAAEMKLVQHRTKTAVLLAQGNPTAAHQEVEKAVALLPELVDQGGIRIEEEWLEELAVEAAQTYEVSETS